MSAPVASKKALSSFFAKSKAKKADDAAAASGAGSSSGYGGDQSDLGAVAEFRGLLGDGSAGGWLPDTPEKAARVQQDRITQNLSKLKMHLVDAGEVEEEDEDVRARIEAEDSAKVLAAVRKKSQKKAGEAAEAAAAAPAPAPTVVVSGWAEKLAARKAGEADGWASAAGAKKKEGAAPNLSSVMEFPTLPGQMAPAGAAGVAAKSKGIGAEMATANPWMSLTGGDDAESDDEEAAAPSRPAATAASAAAPGASAIKAVAPVEDASTMGLAVIGNEKVLTTVAEVKDQAEKIIRELHGGGDVAEAVRRFTELRCTPISLRVKAVEEVLRMASETEKLSSRLAMAKVLLTLVPAKVVTKDMLIEAVGRISSLFDDIRMDAPMAAKWIGEVLSTGVVIGTMTNQEIGWIQTRPVPFHPPAAKVDAGYVPVAYLHVDIAKAVNEILRGKLDKVMASAGSKVKDFGEREDVTEDVEETRAHAAPAAPEPAAPAPAADDAGAADDDFEMATTSKKKKKAKAKVVAEDD